MKGNVTAAAETEIKAINEPSTTPRWRELGRLCGNGFDCSSTTVAAALRGCALRSLPLLPVRDVK
jgi:hypothetical protein